MDTQNTMGADRLLVFENYPLSTNMPFLDGTNLVFCQSGALVRANIPTGGTIWKSIRQNKDLAEKLKGVPRTQTVTYRNWKLAHCDWTNKNIAPISTGLPSNFIERCPTFYQDGDGCHLSFLGGHPTSVGFRYVLYTCSGPDLAHLGSPQIVSSEPTYFGFVSPVYVCSGKSRNIKLVEKATGDIVRLATTFYRVASVTFLAEDPEQLVITGLIDKEHNSRTVLYNLITGGVKDVRVGGDIYKASLSGENIVFTRKIDGSFEDRKLVQGKYTLSTSDINISKEP